MMIRVCDDDPSQQKNWTEEVQKAVADDDRYRVEAMWDAQSSIHELLEREISVRRGSQRENRPSEFDETDILLVDYDLVFIDADRARHTGEGIARLARLHSRCGYVIVMNQGNWTLDFDLTMRGRPQSYADLNLPAKTVSRRGLWSAVPPGDFKPWSWQDIESTVQRREAIAEKLASDNGLLQSILEALEVPASAVAGFSDEAFEFLDPIAQDVDELRKITFTDYLERATEHKNAEALLKYRRDQAARLAVARIAKWMSRLLLGPQDVLVDVPHLLQRCPYLFNPEFGDPADLNTWHRSIKAGEEAVLPSIRQACAFQKSEEWLGRHSFWWSQIEAHPDVKSARDSYNFDRTADLVFAEDTSRFVPFDSAREFRASFHNRFDRRYLEWVDDVAYGPTRRLIFA